MMFMGIDPGETVGFCYKSTRSSGSVEKSISTIHTKFGLLFDYLESIPDSILYKGQKTDLTVGCELFQVRPRIKPSYATMEGIGVIKRICDVQGYAFVGYTASQTKRVTDETLKEAKMWTPGKKHGNDAARVVYLLENKVAGTTLK